MDDAFDLRRFVSAQAPVIDDVRRELRDGRKTTHWMWFVFPQIAGLGRSPTARHFAIASRAEAEAYLEHPMLGPRLVECTRLVLAHRGQAADAIFGFPDTLKFQSCLTLFAECSGDGVFDEALGAFFGGERDAATLERFDRS
jgi:uncharacterized protein (DUF1810 family)